MDLKTKIIALVEESTDEQALVFVFKFLTRRKR